MVRYAALAIVVAIVGTAGSALAETPESDGGSFGFSVRPGAQLFAGGNPWPAIGIYANYRVHPNVTVGGGYEIVRVLPNTTLPVAFLIPDGFLATGLLSGPVLLSTARLTAHFLSTPRKNSWIFRAGAFVGVGSPSFGVVSSHRSANGVIVELGADMTTGYRWGRLELSVFASPSWMTGTVRMSQPNATGSQDVDSFSLQLGLELAVRI